MASTEETVNPIHPSVEAMLDPEIKEIYNKHQSIRLRADQVPFEVYDLDRPKYTFPKAAVAGPFTEVGETYIIKIPVSEPAGEIQIQIYKPTKEVLAAKSVEGKPLPLYVDYHGGGFVIGGLGDDDAFCRKATQTLPCIVANVDYRLSPAYPHPVPTTDSFAALKYLVAHAGEIGVDTSRIAIGGLSAGGCIAASVAQLARDDSSLPPLVLQLLIVPVLDARYMPVPEHGQPDEDNPYESYLQCYYAPMLPMHRLIWFYNLWLGTGPERDERAKDPRASPIVAENLSGLCPATIHAAEVDPLRSEAEAYHAKLLEAGSPSSLKIYKGAVHPFAHWEAKAAVGKEAVDDFLAALKSAFKL